MRATILVGTGGIHVVRFFFSLVLCYFYCDVCAWLYAPLYLRSSAELMSKSTCVSWFFFVAFHSLCTYYTTHAHIIFSPSLKSRHTFDRFEREIRWKGPQRSICARLACLINYTLDTHVCLFLMLVYVKYVQCSRTVCVSSIRLMSAGTHTHTPHSGQCTTCKKRKYKGKRDDGKIGRRNKLDCRMASIKWNMFFTIHIQLKKTTVYRSWCAALRA